MIYAENFVFQNQAVATGNGNLLTVNKNDVITLEILGTATSGTVVFEGLMQSGAYYSIRGIRLSDYKIDNQSTTLNELWQLDTLGLLAVRARISAIDGGYITINAKVVNSNG